MNAYISRTLEIGLDRVIITAAAQLDKRPRDLLDFAINQEIDMPDLDGAIGDLEGAMDEGEEIGLVSLITSLIADLDELQLMSLKARLPI